MALLSEDCSDPHPVVATTSPSAPAVPVPPQISMVLPILFPSDKHPSPLPTPRMSSMTILLMLAPLEVWSSQADKRCSLLVTM